MIPSFFCLTSSVFFLITLSSLFYYIFYILVLPSFSLHQCTQAEEVVQAVSILQRAKGGS